jgi:hypothetical protein
MEQRSPDAFFEQVKADIQALRTSYQANRSGR